MTESLLTGAAGARARGAVATSVPGTEPLREKALRRVNAVVARLPHLYETELGAPMQADVAAAQRASLTVAYVGTAMQTVAALAREAAEVELQPQLANALLRAARRLETGDLHAAALSEEAADLHPDSRREGQVAASNARIHGGEPRPLPARKGPEDLPALTLPEGESDARAVVRLTAHLRDGVRAAVEQIRRGVGEFDYDFRHTGVAEPEYTDRSLLAPRNPRKDDLVTGFGNLIGALGDSAHRVNEALPGGRLPLLEAPDYSPERSVPMPYF